jgi:hypothetical protein
LAWIFVTLIDTAQMNGGGKVEEQTGKAFAGLRVFTGDGELPMGR